MKIFVRILFALLIATTMTGITMAEMTIQAGAGGSPSVYTTGSIYVTSSPAGASAILDGGCAQMFSPGTFRGVEPGTHQVLLALQGFQPYTTTVTVTAGDTENVIATLAAVTSPGGISATSTPRGAGLYVDELYMGKTNQVVGNLAAGPHRVVISEAGYEAWSDIVTVKSGEVVPVTVTLVAEVSPAHGDLQVLSVPSGAAVYIDGSYRGLTPGDDLLDIHDLSPGTYLVAVRKPGYEDYSKSVSIQAGGIVQLTASLQPGEQTAAGVEIASTPAGADVFVNNAYVGITPLSFHEVEAGTYTVDIKMEGYQPFSSTGQVSAGQSVRVIAALSPVPAPSPTPRAPIGLCVVIATLMVAGTAAFHISRR